MYFRIKWQIESNRIKSLKNNNHLKTVDHTMFLFFASTTDTSPATDKAFFYQ